MTSLETMANRTRTITTQAGKEYILPRPSLALRMECLEFAEKAQKLQERFAAEPENELAISRELCSVFIDLLENWLRRNHPDITREQIAEDFDIGDIPEIMGAINSFEAEVAAAVPPAPGRSVRRSTRLTTGRRAVKRK